MWLQSAVLGKSFHLNLQLVLGFLAIQKTYILFHGVWSITSFMTYCFVLVSSLSLISKYINFILEAMCYAYFGKI